MVSPNLVRIHTGTSWIAQSIEHLWLLLACNDFVSTVTAVRSWHDLLPIFDSTSTLQSSCRMGGCLFFWAFASCITSEARALWEGRIGCSVVIGSCDRLT